MVRRRRRGRVLCAWLALMVPAAVSPAVAVGAPGLDIRGVWSCVSSAGGTCTFEIQTLDPSGGAFTGRGSGNGYTWPISGTLDGLKLTMKHGPYDQLPGYTATYDATVGADGQSMSGTYDDGRGAKPFSYPRLSGPPAPTPGAPSFPRPECTNPTTLLVTCADPQGMPGICGPSGTILPQCALPTVLPVVCGPSGTILTPCQARGPGVLACGGFGTILPQCALPPARIPSVCGPSGTLLPPCTGANNPVTVCGPSGTVLPECRFSTRVTGTLLDLTQPASRSSDPGASELLVEIGCPAGAARARTAKGSTPAACSSGLNATITLGSWIELQRKVLVDAARAESENIAQSTPACVQVQSFSCGGPVVNVPYTDEQLGRLARLNATAFVTRVQRLLDDLFATPGDLATFPARVYKRSTVPDLLTARDAPPRYLGDPYQWGNIVVSDAADVMRRMFDTVAVQMLNLKLTKPVKTTSAQATVAAARKRPVVVRRRARVRRGRRLRVRIPITTKLARRLAGREAIKTATILPLRLVVSYRRGKSRPVARVIDIRVRIRHRPRRPGRRASGASDRGPREAALAAHP